MTVVITGSACHRGDLGSIDNAARAARDALTDAGLSADDVATVINCGVFRDNNLAEPAISALIQQRAGIGLNYQPGGRATFGFDLINGPCGPLNAVAVAQALFATNPNHGAVLIVAGDAHPGAHVGDGDPHFPYDSVGGAWVLTQHDGPEGFAAPSFSATDAAVSPTAFVQIDAIGTQGRSALTITADGRTGIHDALRSAIRESLSHNDIPASSVALLVSADGDDDSRHLGEEFGAHSVLISNAHSSGVMEAYRRQVSARADSSAEAPSISYSPQQRPARRPPQFSIEWHSRCAY